MFYAEDNGGKVIYGKVKLLPVEEEKPKEVSLSGKEITVTLNGKSYVAIIK